MTCSSSRSVAVGCCSSRGYVQHWRRTSPENRLSLVQEQVLEASALGLLGQLQDHRGRPGRRAGAVLDGDHERVRKRALPNLGSSI